MCAWRFVRPDFQLGGRGKRGLLQRASYTSSPGHEVMQTLHHIFSNILIKWNLTIFFIRGTREEKFKFIYGILAVESGAFIERGDMTRFILDCDGGSGSGSNLPVSLSTLFTEGQPFFCLICFHRFIHGWVYYNTMHLQQYPKKFETSKNADHEKLSLFLAFCFKKNIYFVVSLHARIFIRNVCYLFTLL